MSTDIGMLETYLRKKRSEGSKLVVPYITGGFKGWTDAIRAAAANVDADAWRHIRRIGERSPAIVGAENHHDSRLIHRGGRRATAKVMEQDNGNVRAEAGRAGGDLKFADACDFLGHVT